MGAHFGETNLTRKGRTMYEYEKVIRTVLGAELAKYSATPEQIEEEMRRVHKHGLDSMTVRKFKDACKKALVRVVLTQGEEKSNERS